MLERQLSENGIQPFTKEMRDVKVPFVTEDDFDTVPENDDRWWDMNFELRKPATLYRCVFGDYS
jgi:hypothetical protein